MDTPAAALSTTVLIWLKKFTFQASVNLSYKFVGFDSIIVSPIGAEIPLSSVLNSARVKLCAVTHSLKNRINMSGVFCVHLTVRPATSAATSFG